MQSQWHLNNYKANVSVGFPFSFGMLNSWKAPHERKYSLCHSFALMVPFNVFFGGVQCSCSSSGVLVCNCRVRKVCTGFVQPLHACYEQKHGISIPFLIETAGSCLCCVLDRKWILHHSTMTILNFLTPNVCIVPVTFNIGDLTWLKS